jgi:diguanylate cyclase (GGDEF)-like protein/PAS domain S-box-containing protein
LQFLHVPSLLLILALVDLIMPVVAYMILEGRRHRAVKLWCSGDLLLGLSMVFFALRGQVPDWVSFPLPNFLMFVGIMVRIQSLRLDLGAPMSLRVMAAITALFMLGHEGIRLGFQDEWLRLIYTQSIHVVMYVALAALAWRIARQEQSHAARWISGVYLLLVVAIIHVLINLSMGRDPPMILAPNVARIGVVLAAVLYAVITNLAYVGLALERSRRQTIQANQEYRAIIATSLDGFLLCDRDGHLLDVNQAYCDLTGYRLEELLTMGVADLEADHAGGGTEVDDGRRWADEPTCFETRQRRKDGGLVDVEVSTQVLPFSPGKIVAFIRDISPRKRAEAEIKALAFYDTLTNLPNRRLLRDRLSQVRAASQRSGHHGALVLLDLDNFKPLNDAYGHAAGDLLLIEVAHRLTLSVRAADTAARLGGDEFVLLIGDLSADEAHAARHVAGLAEQVRSRLSAPYRLTITRPGHADTLIEHRCTASLGVTLFKGPSGTADDILRQADQAMYQAKAGGRDQACVYVSAGGPWPVGCADDRKRIIRDDD